MPFNLKAEIAASGLTKDVTDGTMPSFADLFDRKTAWGSLFYRYAKSEFATENLDFLYEVDAFAPNATRDGFRAIYEKYVPASAETQVNLNAANRAALEDAYRKSAGAAYVPKAYVFNEAKLEIQKMVTADTFDQRFKQLLLGAATDLGGDRSDLEKAIGDAKAGHVQARNEANDAVASARVIDRAVETGAPPETMVVSEEELFGATRGRSGDSAGPPPVPAQAPAPLLAAPLDLDDLGMPADFVPPPPPPPPGAAPVAGVAPVTDAAAAASFVPASGSAAAPASSAGNEDQPPPLPPSDPPEGDPTPPPLPDEEEEPPPLPPEDD